MILQISTRAGEELSPGGNAITKGGNSPAEEIEEKRLHYAFKFLLKEIKAFLDVFKVFATGEDDLS